MSNLVQQTNSQSENALQTATKCRIWGIPKKAQESEMELFILKNLPEIISNQKIYFEKLPGSTKNSGYGSIILNSKEDALLLQRAKIILRGRRVRVKLQSPPKSPTSLENKRICLLAQAGELPIEESLKMITIEFKSARIICLKEKIDLGEASLWMVDFKTIKDAKKFGERLSNGLDIGGARLQRASESAAVEKLKTKKKMPTSGKTLPQNNLNWWGTTKSEKSCYKLLKFSRMGRLDCSARNYRLNQF